MEPSLTPWVRTVLLAMAANHAKTTETVEIWHWNCRSFQKKAAALQCYIDTAIVKPDIICLQEIGKCTVRLRDYYTHYNPDYPRLATLVSKGIASNVSYSPNSQTQHHIVELFPTKRGRAKTVVTNIYSPPKERGTDFAPIITHALASMERKDRLVLVGDFNAPHTNWGYRRDTPKGKLLLHAIENAGLQLETLPSAPVSV